MTENIFNGKVIWFNEKMGFGFIKWKKDNQVQPDLFVHYSDIKESGFKKLNKNQFIEFKLGLNHQQQLKAIEVYII